MAKGVFGSVAALLAAAGMALADGPAAAPTAASTGGSCAAAPVVAAPACDDQAGNGRFWASGEYLLWWFKNSPEPAPLISTGVVGAPGTTTLLGGNSINSDVHSGGRFAVGGWLDCDQRLGVEIGGFFLGGKTVTRGVVTGTDAVGPTIGFPFFNLTTGAPDFFALSEPTVSSGTATETLFQRLFGFSANGLLGLGQPCNCCDCCHDSRERPRLYLLGGFRYVELDEDFGLVTSTTGFPGGEQAGFTSVHGDQINAQNRFYGGNGGVRVEYWSGPWYFAATGQVALGWTHESVDLGGITTTTMGGVTTVTPMSGILVHPSNAGRFTRDRFAVLPEATLNAGVNVTSWAALFVGYNFLYLSDAVRPGQSIDSGFNGTTRPAPILHSTDFWAQGINFGVALRF
jgi:hypothetical protein